MSSHDFVNNVNTVKAVGSSDISETAVCLFDFG
jgi:hypothetical protein